MSSNQTSSSSNCAVGVRLPFIRLRRWLFFCLVAGTTLTGTRMMLELLQGDGISALESLVLMLFAATFCWISISFWNAAIGFVLGLLHRDPLFLKKIAPYSKPEGSLASRTALVMPVRNEDPSQVMNGLAAMLRSLTRTGQGNQFDVHLLSDTTDASIIQREETAWAMLRQRIGGASRLYYRRRARNNGRKAGNIADFCEQWGKHYDFMVVLDADSIMLGPTMVELVHVMETNPNVGLIQTVPIPARRMTLFGRLLQFAGALYSPMLATGQSFWHADSANYWGHNAIIRIEAFMDHCRLPVLSGKPPMGGDILSHDFVEAALMRRAGWHVYLLPTIGGSYEEVPGNILDYAKRDRRWSQGSLQHLRLLFTSGFSILSRLHFIFGAMGYISSLLWLLLLLASTTYIAWPELNTTVPLFTEGSQLFSNAFASLTTLKQSHVIPLLATTIVVLFLPKFFALVLTFINKRQLFGGAARLFVSALLESVFAIITAPLMMMYHTNFVISVLTGHDVRWEPQIRAGREVSWSEAWRRTWGIMGIGTVWAGLTLYISPAFFVWLIPIFVGLLLAAPLVRLTSSRKFGRWTYRRGLFRVPSETMLLSELQATDDLFEFMTAYELEIQGKDQIPC